MLKRKEDNMTNKKKERNDTVKNAEKDQGAGTSEPSLTCRERILKKLDALVMERKKKELKK